MYFSNHVFKTKAAKKMKCKLCWAGDDKKKHKILAKCANGMDSHLASHKIFQKKSKSATSSSSLTDSPSSTSIKASSDNILETIQ